jgi:hypothetical protein
MQLFSNTAEIQGKHEVVYNLMEVAEGLYLPNAYIVSVDQSNLFAHIRQKALDDTIGAFKLELDAVRSKLFAIIEELQPKNLEKKYSPPKKKGQAAGGTLGRQRHPRPHLPFCTPQVG